MQTERDSQIVSWVGGLGAAGAEHVMSEFGMSRSIAYQRLNSLTRDGLLEHHTVLYGRPGMYTATLAGLRWKGIAHLGVFSVRPGSFEHAWQVAQTATKLGKAMPDWDVMSERQLRSVENEYGTLVASIQVGRTTANAKLHRPDLVLTCKRGLVIPIEVELSTKAASRLAASAAAGPEHATSTPSTTSRHPDRHAPSHAPSVRPMRASAYEYSTSMTSPPSQTSNTPPKLTSSQQNK